VNIVLNKNCQFAYVTVGGENVVKIYTTTEAPTLVATIPTGELPHGIWPSGDGTKIYVALENGTGINLIDTLTNKVEARISGGQSSQAVVYIPNAVPSGTGLAHLVPLAESGLAAHLLLGPPGSSSGDAPTTVTLNNQGLIDLLQAAVTGLKPRSKFQLVLLSKNEEPYGSIEPLTTFETNPAGGAIVNTLGPLRQFVAGSVDPNDRRYLAIVPEEESNLRPNNAMIPEAGISRKPVQIQLSSSP
jgi:hypothetical protein